MERLKDKAPALHCDGKRLMDRLPTPDPIMTSKSSWRHGWKDAWREAWSETWSNPDIDVDGRGAASARSLPDPDSAFDLNDLSQRSVIALVGLALQRPRDRRFAPARHQRRLPQYHQLPVLPEDWRRIFFLVTAWWRSRSSTTRRCGRPIHYGRASSLR
jgi:hypothetical protein